MNPERGAAATRQTGASQGETRNQESTSTRTPARPLKWQRVLQAFVDGGSFNRFQAEQQLAEHCLHSTVAVLERRGIRIDRRDETVPGFQGAPTRVRRYKLAPQSLEHARKMLGLCSDPVNADGV